MRYLNTNFKECIPLGDRFYQQQRKTLGTCPGAPKTNQRKSKMAWTDELKEQVIAAYQAANPTPETSVEIVKDIANEFEQSPNGVRMVLSKANVYVKKSPAASGSSSGGSTGSSGGRVSKAAAQEALVAAIKDAGQEADEEIISKMTGKAAQYFTTVLNNINN